MNISAPMGSAHSKLYRSLDRNTMARIQERRKTLLTIELRAYPTVEIAFILTNIIITIYYTQEGSKKHEI